MTERKKPAQWRRVHSDIVYTAAVNHLIKGRAEAIVLHHIADRIRGNKAVCYPTHAQLVADTGLPKATLIRAIDSLVASGLLGRHKGTGGRHSVYWLPLPDVIAASLPAEAAALYAKHLAAMKAHLVAEGYVSSTVQAESHAWDHHSLTDGTISVSSGETHKEDETWKEKPRNTNLTASADLGGEEKEEVEDQIDQLPPLPIPDFKMQLAWGDQWPKTPEKVVTANSSGTDAWTDSRIRDACMAVLGYSSPSPDEDKAVWKTVSESLAGLPASEAMISRYRRGELTTIDVATYLASNGFVPPLTNGGVQYAQAS